MAFLRTPKTRIPIAAHVARARTFSSTSPGFSSTWKGRQADEHVTNSKDDLNVHSSASGSGKQERASGSEHSSSSAAISEKDHGDQNAKAKKDHPEAPGPVIGMNDERGGVSFFFLWVMRCGEVRAN